MARLDSFSADDDAIVLPLSMLYSSAPQTPSSFE